MLASPFEVLEVDPDADAGEIDRAYRSRVLETHPDQGGTRESFQLVRAAYEAIESGEWEPAVDGGGSSKATDAAQAGWRPPGERHRHEGAWVEYLDYDVLEDLGWSIHDEDLFEKADDAGLEPPDRGQIYVRPHESLLEAAESNGFTWPYACRGGACANCAVAMVAGDLEMPASHVLPDEMMDRAIRLSCNGLPTQDEMRVVYNLKHRPDLAELRLPPHRFVRDQASD